MSACNGSCLFTVALLSCLARGVGLAHAREARLTTPPQHEETMAAGRLASTPEGNSVLY